MPSAMLTTERAEPARLEDGNAQRQERQTADLTAIEISQIIPILSTTILWTAYRLSPFRCGTYLRRGRVSACCMPLAVPSAFSRDTGTALMHHATFRPVRACNRDGFRSACLLPGMCSHSGYKRPTDRTQMTDIGGSTRPAEVAEVSARHATCTAPHGMGRHPRYAWTCARLVRMAVMVALPGRHTCGQIGGNMRTGRSGATGGARAETRLATDPADGTRSPNGRHETAWHGASPNSTARRITGMAPNTAWCGKDI